LTLLATRLQELAYEHGFSQCGVVDLETYAGHLEQLEEFLRKGYHGEMAWLARRAYERSHPKHLWPQAKSAFVVAANYGSGHDVFEDMSSGEHAYISVYARRKDYHDVLKKKLKNLVQACIDEGYQAKLFVDTAPLMEKPLAAQAGIGWQGKHTNLVSRQFGSWLFLGVVLTDAYLPANAESTDHCGQCRACMDICPTQAIPEPYKLNAQRCLAYLSIEYKGVIPRVYRRAMGNRVFGCDDCLAICPWNKFAKASGGEREYLRGLPLRDLVGLSDADFRKFFAGTSIKRTGRDAFVRNVLIALANYGDVKNLDVVKLRTRDKNPVVRAHAVAAWKVLDQQDFDQFSSALYPYEQNALVLEELFH